MYEIDERVREAAVARPEGPAPMIITVVSAMETPLVSEGGIDGGRRREQERGKRIMEGEER